LTTPRNGLFRDNERNNPNEHTGNSFKNPSWQEADQLAIYKSGQGVELGSTENNSS